MITAGCDVGSLTTKAVVLNDGRVLGHALVRSSFDPEKSAAEVMEKALRAAGATMDDLGFCVGTGYGRERIGFVKKTFSEITCHAKGVHFLHPAVRTVIDVGGQDCKAIRLDARGEIEKFLTNDKCASGTGRFLEVMAHLLGVDLENLGRVSARATDPVTLAGACTVWAQAEVVMHLNAGRPMPDLAAGVNEAMASRIAILARAVGIEKDVCMSGGVAKNAGVVAAMEKGLGMPMRRLKVDPQLMGALGAAVIAREKAGGSRC